jgi:hypothetical protein
MQVTEHIHAIKIPFKLQVSPWIVFGRRGFNPSPRRVALFFPAYLWGKPPVAPPQAESCMTKSGRFCYRRPVWQGLKEEKLNAYRYLLNSVSGMLYSGRD